MLPIRFLQNDSSARTASFHYPQDGETRSVPCGGDRPKSFTLPWSLTSFQFEIQRSRISRCLVAEVNTGIEKIIAGTLIAWVIVDEMHIGTIAVDQPFRRVGIASALLDVIHQQAYEEQLGKIYLEVRKSNLPAQNLYRKFGYEITGVRQGYYADNHEDALLMEHQVEGQ
jgi:ribosomal-protein-alanine N-acetyltransferase